MKIETLLIAFLVVWAILFPIGIVRTIRKFKKTEKSEHTEEERAARLKQISFFIKSMRFVGWWFLIVGSIMLISAIPPIFDPEATINVNGVPRKELWIKVITFLFEAIAPTIGTIIVFTPRRTTEDFLLKFLSFSKRFATASKMK